MRYNEKEIKTVDDYMALEIYAPFQLINGEMVDWPSRTVIHQRVLGQIMFTFSRYADASSNKGFFVHGPIDVLLDNWNVLTPDFVYISEERKNIITEQTIGAPDIAVEVLNPANAYYDLRPKKDLYEMHGVKEYLIFDPLQENAEVHILENGVFVLKQKASKTETLNSILLPGLSFDLEKIFA